MKYIGVLVICCMTLSTAAQTVEQVEKELIRQKVPHHKIVLAQARHETGNFKSNLCKKNHNLFGIKHNGKYAKYKRWQDSVTDYKEKISSRYKGGNYYTFLRKIGYAKDEQYIHKLKRY